MSISFDKKKKKKIIHFKIESNKKINRFTKLHLGTVRHMSRITLFKYN